MESSSFIVSLVAAQRVLSICQPLSKALQKTKCDIVKAYEDAAVCKDTILNLRKASMFADSWQKSKTVADSIGEKLTKPRTARCSIYRSNAGCDLEDGDEEYFRRNVYYPFIDHCVQQFSSRFPDAAKSSFLGYKLLPSKLSTLTNSELDTIEKYYSPDLPCRQSFRGEIEKWKTKYSHETPEQSDLVDILTVADRDFFPNIHEIMRLILTLPVGSVPCERSFSALRRLKDWSRSSMSENRLNGLALLYTHRDMELNYENVLRRFDASGHRRIGSLNLSKE